MKKTKLSLFTVVFLIANFWNASLHAFPSADEYYAPPSKRLISQKSARQSIEVNSTQSKSVKAHPDFQGLNPSQIFAAKRHARASLNVKKTKQVSQLNPFSSLPQSGRDLEYFLESPSLAGERNLEKIEALNLQSAKIEQDAWSDSYWPIYKGILGNRYNDEEFDAAGRGRFRDFYNYIQRSDRQFPAIVAGVQDPNDSRLLNLSPSEKYDLLLGDSNSLLTKKMWADGNRYADESGNVEAWMGICHGWAPAAYKENRPTHRVQVMAHDQKTLLTFYPSDIKALATLLWANGNSPMLAIGARCNEKDPQRGENGRLLNPECEDIHPGLWHLSVINKIGVQKRSFVMDATWDYEVWNQPVLSYKISYFDVTNNDKTGKSFQDVAKLRSEVPEDPYAKFRSPLTHKIVGVEMTVEYLSENSPSHNATDSRELDQIVEVTYFYDLELDDKNNIVGGEWYQFHHPDFLWDPPAGSLAWAWADRASSSVWTGEGPVPAALRRAAISGSRSSSSLGQPLGKVVRTLIDLSQR